MDLSLLEPDRDAVQATFWKPGHSGRVLESKPAAEQISDVSHARELSALASFCRCSLRYTLEHRSAAGLRRTKKEMQHQPPYQSSALPSSTQYLGLAALLYLSMSSSVCLGTSFALAPLRSTKPLSYSCTTKLDPTTSHLVLCFGNRLVPLLLPRSI